MKWLTLLTISVLLNFKLSQLISGRKRKKQKYKGENRPETSRVFHPILTVSVVTPAPVCIERQESVFSVTGFLTFAVVASTAVSNVIANIGRDGSINISQTFYH